jgi:hypothetical protein
VLDRHNAYRARHHAAPLSWDADLAAAAQGYANQCRGLVHSGPGECLCTGHANWANCVEDWYREARARAAHAGRRRLTLQPLPSSGGGSGARGRNLTDPPTRLPPAAAAVITVVLARRAPRRSASTTSRRASFRMRRAT